ncbi:MAG: bifunctional hydroxymethylpyrimidine kinase/phosphomethylpyrimidine kinase [Myxococcota bacterium]|nr:bifunctional hydroxymethylpyrimidine kinase/phosphomethylpyrimidine kinase [Myxococcota bacterium]
MTAVALTIAGSDPSGGAGIQADLKTFHQHGVYGTAAITLLTVQNTKRVSHVEVMRPQLVIDQVEAVLEDVPPQAAKTGALGTRGVVEAVAALAERFTFPLVVDPVMISKHGARLIEEDAAFAMRDRLFPHATLITPNAHEASWLVGFEVKDRVSARDAARALQKLGPRGVLIKGGHLSGDNAVDLLFVDGHLTVLSAERVDSAHTHGTGCTYSAAITALLARGEPLLEAVSEAKGWLTEAIRNPPKVGGGIGPVGHFVPVTRKSIPPEG